MSTEAATPRVAVLIPCYKDGALVAEAVDSIQESEPFELVVIDDCSPDELTQEVMADLAAARRDRDPPRAQPRRGRRPQHRPA